ncbi:MAG: NmrA family NAD(P)-binding protein [Sphingobium sp.]|nr:NmrA family NAD(P)-binding protein [Sphingobium sp.]
MSGKPVLIIGAGGMFGRHVAPEVIARGGEVRGLVRHAAGKGVARAAGVKDIVVADLRDEPAMHQILKDVSRVFYIPPKFLPDEAAVGVRLVEMASEAGVERFVLSGVIHPFISEMANHCAKLPVQEALITSGMNYTILQPANLMQSIGSFFLRGVMDAGEYVDPGDKDKAICWVDYRDVAEAAAKALTEDSLSYGVFELSAAGMISMEAVVSMLSETLGRTITTRNQPVEEWVAENLPPDPVLREGFIGMGKFYSRYGFSGGNDLALRAILGRAPRTIATYIYEIATQSSDRFVNNV